MTIDELVAQQAFQTTSDFLDTLKNNNITDINEYLLFNLNDRMKEVLFTNIDFLADDTLWSKEDLENFEVIAKTIDNDYLLSQGDTSLIIPSSLPFGLSILAYILSIVFIALIIGVIESAIARFRMSHVFEFVFIMSSLALVVASLAVVKIYGV